MRSPHPSIQPGTFHDGQAAVLLDARTPELLIRIASQAHVAHLAASGMAPINPTFRWLNCGFLRVFTAEQGIRLIDTFVADSFGFTEL